MVALPPMKCIGGRAAKKAFPGRAWDRAAQDCQKKI